MTLDEVLESDFIDDNTAITLVKGKRQIRDKWYSDRILDHSEEQVEYVGAHVSQNSVTIILS